MTEHKLFPLRLPPNFHGKQKAFRRLSDIYVEKSAERQPENPEVIRPTISNWQVKRFDKDIVKQRREFLVHPAKISQDTPDWFKATLHHFHRSNYGPRHRPDRSEELRYTVLNQKRTNPFQRGEVDLQRSTRIRREQPIAEKIGSRDSSYNARWVTQREVTCKIGSVESRDYSVPQPLLKIGQTHAHNFINTYQIA